MSSNKKKINFFESQAGAETKQALREMTADDAYKTEPTYSANTMLYPNNLIPFIDKHMDYLRAHPATDPQHYISNLRLMTRIK